MSTPSYLSRVPASGSGGISKPRQDSAWNNRAMSLTGGDANIYKEESPKDIFMFRSLKAGTGITMTQGSNFVTINGASSTSATSLGGDADIYKATVLDVLQFRGLTAGTGITLTEGVNDITIDGASTIYDVNDNVVVSDSTGTITLAAGTAESNVGIGNSVFGVTYATMDGDYNVALGYHSMQNLTTGSYNIGLGFDSLLACTTGSNNIALGQDALEACQDGLENIAIGYDALGNLTSGDYNIGIGINALDDLISGDYNIAIGRDALTNVTGNANVGIGNNALDLTSTGINNTSLGASSGHGITSGDNNIAIGNQCINTSNTASYNVGCGYQCLRQVTGGTNTAYGTEAGEELTTGTGNVFVGYRSGQGLGNVSNRLVIGTETMRTIDGNLTTGDVTVGNDIITNDLQMTEQAGSAAVANKGTLWVNTSGDLNYYSDKFATTTNLTVATTVGDLVYTATGPVNARLNIGSTDDVLVVASGLPAWRAPSLQTYEAITAIANDSTINAVSTTVQHTFIDVTSDGGAGTLAKLTLANAATTGTVKNLYCRTIANAGVDSAEVKITTYLDAAGSAGTKSFTFTIAGQSVMIAWNGTQWQARDTGATLGASTF